VAEGEHELRSHLEPSEKLLWVGRPTQGIVFTPADWYLIPFSLLWLGIALVNFWHGIKTPQPIAGLMAVLVMGVGIYVVVGRYLTDWLYRSRLIYGVTDRRAIIVSGVLSRSVQSIDLSSLSGLKVEERGDGTGTISFGDQRTYGMHGSGYHISHALGTQFFRVTNVRMVYSIVHEEMRRLKK
jgi:hypothetical protein